MIKKDIIQPINDLIEKRAKELKNKIAYADETEKISYENLNIETKSLSFYLNEKKAYYKITLLTKISFMSNNFQVSKHLARLVLPLLLHATILSCTVTCLVK